MTQIPLRQKSVNSSVPDSLSKTALDLGLKTKLPSCGVCDAFTKHNEFCSTSSSPVIQCFKLKDKGFWSFSSSLQSRLIRTLASSNPSGNTKGPLGMTPYIIAAVSPLATTPGGAESMAQVALLSFGNGYRFHSPPVSRIVMVWISPKTKHPACSSTSPTSRTHKQIHKELGY